MSSDLFISFNFIHVREGLERRAASVLLQNQARGRVRGISLQRAHEFFFTSTEKIEKFVSYSQTLFSALLCPPTKVKWTPRIYFTPIQVTRITLLAKKKK